MQQAGYTPLPGATVAAPLPAFAMPSQMFGVDPVQVQCGNCHQTVTTEVRKESGKCVTLTSLMLCLFCCCPCMIIPLCTDMCKDAHHNCPECGVRLGSYMRLQQMAIGTSPLRPSEVKNLKTNI